MPELPDVEVFRRYFDATSLHKKITGVEVSDGRLLRDVSRRRLASILVGASFGGTARHGKFLFAEIRKDGGGGGGGWLVLHFGMTGYLEYFKADGAGQDPKHARFAVDFANGFRLAYMSRRRLGRMAMAKDPEGFARSEGLGPDALSVDLDRFRELLEGRRGGIKSFLMNQKAIAGVGNVYSDETLFQARIHPEREAAGLDGGEVKALHRALQRVLETAIDRKVSDFPRTWLLSHRSEGSRCPRCGGGVERLRVAGRSAYLCPRCQG